VGLTISRQVRRLLWITGAVTASVLGSPANGLAAADTPAPTFNKDVAPILFKHCANCHRPGEMGSAVSLVSYDGARPWAQSIKQQVVQREMPPWPADPSKSMEFRNDPRLSQQEIDTLVAWVDAGMPKGNDADLPPLPSFPQGWLYPSGRAPDLVIPLREFHLPPKGEIPYVRYMAKVPFAEDKWIVALQVRPGNAAVVHHMAITEVALDNGVTPDDLDRLARVARQLGLPSGSIATRPAVADPANPAAYDMLGVYTPGTTLETYGDGSAKVLKGGKNMYLNFNIHYQTTGTPETDQSMLAFWFQPDPPKRQLFRVPASGETIIADGRELLTDAPGQKAEGTGVAIPPIPPYAENYELIGITAYTEPVTIYQLQPHAHLRGKDFQYTVVYPDGREESVLSVPKYDFHWQVAYELDKPLELPAGSKLVVTAHYDNSLKNEHLLHHHGASDTPHNLGPDKEVFFREANQSWDEMFTPFIQYSIDNEDPAKPAQPQHSQNENTKTSQQVGQPARNALKIAEVVGCLAQDPSGTWMLTNASEAVVSESQPTSSVALKAAAVKPPGKQLYQLLGVGAFDPSSHKGQKTAVKGVLIKDGKRDRLNVTSLQTVATACF
jgi:mono/diheme cytochrome c family protein